jgi:hypothetical protein
MRLPDLRKIQAQILMTIFLSLHEKKELLGCRHKDKDEVRPQSHTPKPNRRTELLALLQFLSRPVLTAIVPLRALTLVLLSQLRLSSIMNIVPSSNLSRSSFSCANQPSIHANQTVIL